jgi:hypothetical protein
MTVSHSMEEISEKHKNTIQNQQQNLEREEEVIQNIDLEEQNPLNKKIEIFQVKQDEKNELIDQRYNLLEKRTSDIETKISEIEGNKHKITFDSNISEKLCNIFGGIGSGVALVYLGYTWYTSGKPEGIFYVTNNTLSWMLQCGGIRLIFEGIEDTFVACSKNKEEAEKVKTFFKYPRAVLTSPQDVVYKSIYFLYKKLEKKCCLQKQ